MRHNLAELLSSAVSYTYGSYYGTVLSALAARSRTSSAALIRALPKLSSSDVRLALVTLVQQHIVNHHTEESGITYYEPNWDHAYNFTCRLPALNKFMEERYDAKIADVFDSIAHAGTVTVGDLVAQLGPTTQDEKPAQQTGADNHDTPIAKASTDGDAATNGTASKNGSAARRLLQETQEKELYGALNLLLTAGYVMRVNMRQFWPPHDRETEAIGEIILAQFPSGTSAKRERDALQEESTKLLRRWRDEDDSYISPMMNGSARNGRKRAHSPGFPDFRDDDEERPAKRRQLNGQLPAVVGKFKSWLSEHQDPLDHGLVLAVNYEKCAVGLRTNQFTQYCERHVSPTTAKVYGALLRAIEGNTSRCYDVLERRPEVERDFFGPVYDKPKKKDIGLSEPITTREVANVLDPAIELDDGLAPEPDDDVAPSIEGANGVNGHPENDDGGDIPTDSRLRKIEQHLHLLLCDPRGFVQITHREWRVPFHAITQRIIEGEIENIVTHTLGTLPTRMLRILKYFGHQELRALAAKAMVTEDQARTACQHLQSAGWIEVVELPRTARREVTKSMWLWSYDVLKARQRVLSDCYFTMARLSVRLSHDRQTIEQVINKAERSDVQGNEDKYLTDKEKEAIAKLDKTTHAVVRQMIRMDEIVALMRDFSTMEYPHKIWDMGWVEWHSPSREPTDDEKKTIEEYEARGREDADENEMSGEDDEGADGLLEPE